MSGQRPCVVYTCLPPTPTVPTILQRRTAIRSSLGWHSSALEWASGLPCIIMGQCPETASAGFCISVASHPTMNLLPLLLFQRTYSYLAWLPPLLLFYFFFSPHFTPVYNLLRIVKHQHSIRKLLQFLAMVLVYFTHPFPHLLLKKSVLCAISLHLYLHLLSSVSVTECFVS